MVRWMPRSLAAALALTALTALACGSATAAPFKCVTGSGVTYSQLPCPGGRDMAPAARRVTDKTVPPPQDRATLARRATLSADEKQECRTLDKTMRDQQAQLKARGDGATIEDEMPLVRNKKRYRELGC